MPKGYENTIFLEMHWKKGSKKTILTKISTVILYRTAIWDCQQTSNPPPPPRSPKSITGMGGRSNSQSQNNILYVISKVSYAIEKAHAARSVPLTVMFGLALAKKGGRVRRLKGVEELMEGSAWRECVILQAEGGKVQHVDLTWECAYGVQGLARKDGQLQWRVGEDKREARLELTGQDCVIDVNRKELACATQRALESFKPMRI